MRHMKDKQKGKMKNGQKYIIFKKSGMKNNTEWFLNRGKR